MKKRITSFILFVMLCNIFSPLTILVKAEEKEIKDYINDLNTSINSIDSKLTYDKNDASSNLSVLSSIENDINSFKDDVIELKNDLSNLDLSDLVDPVSYDNYSSKGCSNIKININSINDIECTYDDNGISTTSVFFYKEDLKDSIYNNYIKSLNEEINNYNYEEKKNSYKSIYDNYFNYDFNSVLSDVNDISDEIKEFISENEEKGNVVNNKEVVTLIEEDINKIEGYKDSTLDLDSIKSEVNALVNNINNKKSSFYSNNKSYTELGIDTKISDLTNKYNELVNSYKNWFSDKEIDTNNIVNSEVESNIDSDFVSLFRDSISLDNEYKSLSNEIDIYLERVVSDKDVINTLMNDLNSMNSKINSNTVFAFIEDIINSSSLEDEDSVDRLYFATSYDINEIVKKKLIDKKNSFYSFNINNYEYEIVNNKLVLYNLLSIPSDLSDNILYNASFVFEDNSLSLLDRNNLLLNKYSVVLCGDLNSDYVVNEDDLDLLYELILSNDLDDVLDIADMNKDEIVDILDLGLLSNLINNNIDTTDASYRVVKSIKDNTITYNIYLKSNGMVNGFSYKIKASNDLVFNKIVTNNKAFIKDNLVMGYGIFNDGDLLVSIVYDKKYNEEYTSFEIYDGIITFGNTSKTSSYKDIVKNIRENEVTKTSSVVNDTNEESNEELAEEVILDDIEDESKNSIGVTDLEDENKVEVKNIIKVVIIVLLGALIIYFLSKDEEIESVKEKDNK